MSLKIRSIPVLKGSLAKEFVKKAEDSFKSTERIDFSDQIKSSRKILEKSKSDCFTCYFLGSDCIDLKGCSNQGAQLNLGL